ncbi:UNVERIFIED_CONTAM: hypothetical protein Slati_0193400 [Sesamum latifolium]|uniref:Uncharacterized protein n=1 Tax=Sesamum latifolium TaxID=2727402 RepID=A0AAW2YBC1_9LAMI
MGITGPDAVLGASTPTSTRTIDQTNGLAIPNPLFLEHLRQFIMDTDNSAVRRSQTSGMAPSSQAERGGTPASHSTGEPDHGIQQYTPLPTEFRVKETAGNAPTNTLQSLEMEVMKLRQQVNRETLPTERGVTFSQHIMIEELPAHF